MVIVGISTVYILQYIRTATTKHLHTMCIHFESKESNSKLFGQFILPSTIRLLTSVVSPRNVTVSFSWFFDQLFLRLSVVLPASMGAKLFVPASKISTFPRRLHFSWDSTRLSIGCLSFLFWIPPVYWFIHLRMSTRQSRRTSRKATIKEAGNLGLASEFQLFSWCFYNFLNRSYFINFVVNWDSGANNRQSRLEM